MNAPERFIELDIWRGLAIMGMIAFHFVFLMDYGGYSDIFYNHGWWNILARFVQFSFLLLVGIGMHLSYQKSVIRKTEKKSYYLRQMKRAGIVFSFGMVVTFFTFLFIPGEYVRFGILHLIGTSIFFLCFIAPRPLTAGLVGLSIFFLSTVVKSIAVSSPFLLPFGFFYPFSSVDYFPIFPWMAVPALGIFVGSCFYDHYQPRWWDNERANILLDRFFPISTLGKNSLLIYLIHIPILIAVLWTLDRFLY